MKTFWQHASGKVYAVESDTFGRIVGAAGPFDIDETSRSERVQLSVRPGQMDQQGHRRPHTPQNQSDPEAVTVPCRHPSPSEFAPCSVHYGHEQLVFALSVQC